MQQFVQLPNSERRLPDARTCEVTARHLEILREAIYTNGHLPCIVPASGSFSYC